MTQDAFELLQEANPLPEDPPPLPIAPLLERVEQLPPLPPVGKGPDRRSKGRLTLIAVAAVAVGVLAFTRSTTQSPPGGSVAGVVVPPEVESIAAGQADPDEYLDLKQSSASAVSEAQVRQAQAQAADVPAAADGIAWQQLGPYNVGGRVVDVQRTSCRQRRLRGGLGRRRLAQRRRGRELDPGVAGRPDADDGRARAGRRRHPVGRYG